MGRQPANTKISSNVSVRRVRVRGGNSKFRALRLDHGNFSWGSEVISCRVGLVLHQTPYMVNGPSACCRVEQLVAALLDGSWHSGLIVKRVLLAGRDPAVSSGRCRIQRVEQRAGAALPP